MVWVEKNPNLLESRRCLSLFALKCVVKPKNTEGVA